MDLKLFFSPVAEQVYQDIKDVRSFYKSISVFTELMPDYQQADIALMGVPEDRGAGLNAGTAKGIQEIRHKLYRLKKGNGPYKVVDLGDLNLGHDLEQSYGRLREVCEHLIGKNVLPVIIGGSQDLDIAQYTAYQGMDKLVSFLNIDAFLDLEDQDQASWNQKHINRILLHEPNFLFHYSHLAYQSYLVDQERLEILQKMYFEMFRIGEIRTNFTETEPIIRDADLISFDITAIKSNDAPGNALAQPFGLTGEEACQVCWYAGLNEKLSSIGFYEYNPDHDDPSRKTASVVATMIWYFIEGYYQRKDNLDYKSNNYLKYVVSLPAKPGTLVFYKSKLSEKWWMEITSNLSRSRYGRSYVIPCGYSDYETATQGEIPERYISALSKFI
ncbi:MAG: formimidoylglutamase [Candidatus Cyclobacteriaceae bacterium M3_2C_046]